MAQPISRQVKTIASVVGMLLTAGAHADWKGQGEFGMVFARGNANTESGNLKLNLSTDLGRWKHSAMGRVLYGRSNGIQAAERWETLWQSELRLNNQPFIFGTLRHEQDEFGGFAYQTSFSTGLGYNFVDTTTTQLSGSLGGGYRRLQPQIVVRDSSGEVIDRIEGEPTAQAMGKAGLNYRHQITPSTAVINTLLVETGSTNTLVTNDLSLQVAMTRKLALGIGYSLRHNAQPPAGLRETDQLTTVNLVYKLQ